MGIEVALGLALAVGVVLALIRRSALAKRRRAIVYSDPRYLS